jgi:hypothetical protein
LDTQSLDALGVAPNGDIFACGGFFESLAVGSQVLRGKSSANIYLVKVSAAGSVLWARHFAAPFPPGRSAILECAGLAADATGGVVMTGRFMGAADVGGGAFPKLETSSIFVASYDETGAHRWSKTFGTATTNSEGKAIAVDTAGNVLLGAVTNGALDLGGGLLAAPRDGVHRGLLSKFTSAGAHLWSRVLDGTLGGTVRALTATTGGDVLVGGSGRAGRDPDGSFPFGNTLDAYLARYGGDGALQWARTFATDEAEEVTALAANLKGEIALGLQCKAAISIAGVSLPKSGTADACILRLPAGLIP